MKTITRNYESLYIVDPTLTDEQLESVIAKYSNVVAEQGGEVQGAGRWEKRRLAYDVAGHGEGMYILMYFSGDSSVMGELDRLFRIGDDVFRHIIVRIDPERIDTKRLERAQPPTEKPAEEAKAAEGAAEPAVEAVTEEAAVEAKAQTPAESEAEPAAEAAGATEAEAETPAEEATAPEPEEAAAPADEEKVEETSSEGSNDQPKKEDE